jgi:hypothetical protein
MQQPARAMMDHHQHMEQPEGRRHRDEEIIGDDCLGVVAQERGPTLIAAWVARGRFGMYLRTVRGETRRPSLSNSSLAIRSSPHSGFYVAITPDELA